MNLTPSFWVRAAFSNVRAVVLLVIILVGGGSKIARHDGEQWGALAVTLAFASGLVGLYLWRLTRSIKKKAEQINESVSRITLDAQGLGTASFNGMTTFAPWSQFSRWKEGRLVFTIGGAKTFSTVPKRALRDSEVSEVRGLLQTQIRGK